MIEFESRHNFSSEDIKVLQDNHPSVKLIDIPEAWIIIIDDMLKIMNFAKPLKEVRQYQGLLITIFKNNIDLSKFNTFRSIIMEKERELYDIDIDLHNKKEPECLN